MKIFSIPIFSRTKLHVCHNVTVDDLHHLQRGGRVSKTAGGPGAIADIIDEDILDPHLLPHALRHVLCVFNAVSVGDHDNLIVPAF